jgi:hypothetical protein
MKALARCEKFDLSSAVYIVLDDLSGHLDELRLGHNTSGFSRTQRALYEKNNQVLRLKNLNARDVHRRFEVSRHRLAGFKSFKYTCLRRIR